MGEGWREIERASYNYAFPVNVLSYYDDEDDDKHDENSGNLLLILSSSFDLDHFQANE